MKFDARENPEVTARVVIALRGGLGVEDMQARGIVPADYARVVISRLRHYGLLSGIYRKYRVGSGVPHFKEAAE